MPRAAVFLDRDGVLNENRSDYCKSWSEIRFLPRVFEELSRLNTWPLAVVLVTNQAAVGHGLISLEQAHDINRRMIAEIRARGGRVDAEYLCPHRPQEGCACRKPAPGMLLRARDDLDLDLGRSFLIGDAASDLRAARAAGVQGILVLSGRGREEITHLTPEERAAHPAVSDLGAALDCIRVSDRSRRATDVHLNSSRGVLF